MVFGGFYFACVYQCICILMKGLSEEALDVFENEVFRKENQNDGLILHPHALLIPLLRLGSSCPFVAGHVCIIPIEFNKELFARAVCCIYPLRKEFHTPSHIPVLPNFVPCPSLPPSLLSATDPIIPQVCKTPTTQEIRRTPKTTLDLPLLHTPHPKWATFARPFPMPFFCFSILRHGGAGGGGGERREEGAQV